MRTAEWERYIKFRNRQEAFLSFLIKALPPAALAAVALGKASIMGGVVGLFVAESVTGALYLRIKQEKEMD